MDGFTGNVVLKASESAAELVFELIRAGLPGGVRGALAWLLLKPAFVAVRRRSDPAEIGGAPLLGLRGCCVIGHGKSSARAIEAGIRTAAFFHRSGVNGAIESDLRTLGRAPEGAANPRAASA
jgi:glycerol-3-phosphate acyltransferase PlsX